MKPQIEKPSERPMRFFTPELYRRFNSADDEVANRANDDWETALHDYNRHLADLRDSMPAQVRKLAELSLHDSELLALDEEIEPLSPLSAEQFWPSPFWLANAIFSVKQDGQVVTLIYLLWDHVREHTPQQDWPFSKLRKHWLYDEIDIAANSPGRFVHRILFSDGNVLEVPFAAVVIHSIPWKTSGKPGTSRKIA